MTVTLARDTISHDMVEAFEQILEEARAGRAVGAVFGIHLKGRRYVVNCAGTLVKNPTLARGITAALDDELQRMVQGRVDSDTTI